MANEPKEEETFEGTVEGHTQPVERGVTANRPPSKEELDERQRRIGTHRKPYGPPRQREIVEKIDPAEIAIDVPPTKPEQTEKK